MNEICEFAYASGVVCPAVSAGLSAFLSVSMLVFLSVPERLAKVMR